MGTLRFFEEVVSFKIRRTFGFADYTASGKQDTAEIRYREKRKKSPPEMNEPAGNVTIKERASQPLM